MAVRIHLHKTHRQYAGGLDVVEVNGTSVGDCLDDLIRRYPQMHDQLFDAKGNLKKTIEIYLNMHSAYPDELAKVTQEGDAIHIIVMLAGG